MDRAVASIAILSITTLSFAGPPLTLADLCQGPAPSPTESLDKAIMSYIDSTRADAHLPPLKHDDFSNVKMQQHACRTAADQSRWVDRDEYLERVPIYRPLRRAIESEQYCHVGMWHFVRNGLVIGGVGLRKCVGMAL